MDILSVIAIITILVCGPLAVYAFRRHRREQEEQHRQHRPRPRPPRFPTVDSILDSMEWPTPMWGAQHPDQRGLYDADRRNRVRDAMLRGDWWQTTQ